MELQSWFTGKFNVIIKNDVRWEYVKWDSFLIFQEFYIWNINCKNLVWPTLNYREVENMHFFKVRSKRQGTH